jgi:hypothetical protein
VSFSLLEPCFFYFCVQALLGIARKRTRNKAVQWFYQKPKAVFFKTHLHILFLFLIYETKYERQVYTACNQNTPASMEKYKHAFFENKRHGNLDNKL